MAKGASKKKLTIDRWLLGASVILTFTVIGIAISIMAFTGNQLLNAFVPQAQEDPKVQFDFERYQEVSERL